MDVARSVHFKIVFTVSTLEYTHFLQHLKMRPPQCLPPSFRHWIMMFFDLIKKVGVYFPLSSREPFLYAWTFSVYSALLLPPSIETRSLPSSSLTLPLTLQSFDAQPPNHGKKSIDLTVLFCVAVPLMIRICSQVSLFPSISHISLSLTKLANYPIFSASTLLFLLLP